MSFFFFAVVSSGDKGSLHCMGKMHNTLVNADYDFFFLQCLQHVPSSKKGTFLFK